MLSRGIQEVTSSLPLSLDVSRAERAAAAAGNSKYNTKSIQSNTSGGQGGRRGAGETAHLNPHTHERVHSQAKGSTRTWLGAV